MDTYLLSKYYTAFIRYAVSLTMRDCILTGVKNGDSDEKAEVSFDDFD